jgi:hypothetical protein
MLNSTPRRFASFHFIATFFKVMGVIIGVTAIIVAIFMAVALPIGGSLLGNLIPTAESPERLYSYGILSGVLTALIVLIVGGLWGALTYGIGEMFYVLIAIEQNTRSIEAQLKTLQE